MSHNCIFLFSEIKLPFISEKNCNGNTGTILLHICHNLSQLKHWLQAKLSDGESKNHTHIRMQLYRCAYIKTGCDLSTHVFFSVLSFAEVWGYTESAALLTSSLGRTVAFPQLWHSGEKDEYLGHFQGNYELVSIDMTIWSCHWVQSAVSICTLLSIPCI